MGTLKIARVALLMHGVVNGGDQVGVQVKAAVKDDVHQDDNIDVNGLRNYPTRCS